MEEYDLIMSLEYQGNGTIQVDGQPCNVTKYRTSISVFRTSGERIQYTGTRPNGQACSNVEVLSGADWNEDIPGAELVPGKGKATPMPATVEERMICLRGKSTGCVQGRCLLELGPTSDDPQTAIAIAQPM